MGDGGTRGTLGGGLASLRWRTGDRKPEEEDGADRESNTRGSCRAIPAGTPVFAAGRSPGCHFGSGRTRRQEAPGPGEGGARGRRRERGEGVIEAARKMRSTPEGIAGLGSAPGPDLPSGNLTWTRRSGRGCPPWETRPYLWRQAAALFLPGDGGRWGARRPAVQSDGAAFLHLCPLGAHLHLGDAGTCPGAKEPSVPPQSPLWIQSEFCSVHY